jgi:hypothetical protein
MDVNAAILLAAALNVAPGAPGERDSEDFSADCFLGDWEGSESRLVSGGATSVPFFVGTPGEGLERAGEVPLVAGPRGRGDVTVSSPQVFWTTEAWTAFDVEDTDVVVPVGIVFVVSDCEEAGCRVLVGDQDLWAPHGSWAGTPVPQPIVDEGWWVPVVREEVAGWVQGAGFVVEVRCVGPDEGADLSLAEWHSL